MEPKNEEPTSVDLTEDKTLQSVADLQTSIQKQLLAMEHENTQLKLGLLSTDVAKILSSNRRNMTSQNRLLYRGVELGIQWRRLEQFEQRFGTRTRRHSKSALPAAPDANNQAG